MAGALILILLDGVVRDHDGHNYVDPVLAATAGLFAVTAYYAWQNHRMAIVAAAQVAATIEADAGRRREAQVLATRPFMLGQPGLQVQPQPLALFGLAPRQEVLGLTVTLRAMREQPADGSADGRDSVSTGVGSHHPSEPYAIQAFLPLGAFLRGGETTALDAFEDVSQVQLFYHGILG